MLIKTKKFFAVRIKTGEYIKEDYLVTTSQPLNVSDDISKAKLWTSKGWTERFLNDPSYVKMMKRDDYQPEIVEITLDFSIKG